jgi:hypothetical protein
MMARTRSITPVMPEASEPFWQVAEPIDGIICHSLEVHGPDMIERARTAAYERIAALPNSSLLHPPGIVGRGDHAYVELHVRAHAAPAVPVVVDLARDSLDGHHDIAGEGL